MSDIVVIVFLASFIGISTIVISYRHIKEKSKAIPAQWEKDIESKDYIVH